MLFNMNIIRREGGLHAHTVMVKKVTYYEIIMHEDHDSNYFDLINSIISNYDVSRRAKLSFV